MSYIITMCNADGTQCLNGMSWSHDFLDATVFDTEEKALAEIETVKRECAAQLGAGDYGIYQLQAREFVPFLRGVSSFRTEEEDEGYGGSYTMFTICHTQRGLSDEQLRELVREDFPVWRCEHEYDCCGHYYPSTADWSRTSFKNWESDQIETIIVRQGFAQNV